MLGDIVEIVLELIFDGMADAAGSKRVPMPIRITLGAFLTLFVLGLFGLLLYVGIHSGSVVLTILSVVLVGTAIFWAAFKIKAFKVHRR